MDLKCFLQRIALSTQVCEDFPILQGETSCGAEGRSKRETRVQEAFQIAVKTGKFLARSRHVGDELEVKPAFYPNQPCFARIDSI